MIFALEGSIGAALAQAPITPATPTYGRSRRIIRLHRHCKPGAGLMMEQEKLFCARPSQVASVVTGIHRGAVRQ